MSSVYVATRAGVVRVGGDPGPVLTDRSPECATIADGDLYVGTFESGLWRVSTDAFDSPERVAAFDGDPVTALAVADDGSILAGTEPSRVHRSSDGDRWQETSPLTALASADQWSFPPRPHTHHVRWLEPTPDDPESWYVAVEAGAVVRTTDAGASWIDRTPDGPRDTHQITTHPDRPNAAWVAAGDGYAETTDRGESWRFPTDGLGHGYCWSLATPPDDPETVLVSAAQSARSAHTAARAETYCYRRDRAADTWERLDGRGLPMGEGVTRPVFSRGKTAGEVYAASNRGCHRTTDGGDSWESVGEWPAAFEETTVSGLCVG